MTDQYTIPALHRAITVLELLANEEEAVGLAELTRRSGIPKSTLYRILSTLRNQQCVVFNEREKTYRLGLKLWELGRAYLNQSDLYKSAIPYMKELADACQESVFLGVLSEGEVTYVRRMESPKSVLAVRKLGQRVPAYCTATGRAMLAFQSSEEVDRLLKGSELTGFTSSTETNSERIKQALTQIHKRKVAVVDGEFNPDLLCVSSPVFSERHRPVAALTVAVLSPRTSSERVQELSEHVHQSAQRLSRELGHLGDGKA